MLEFLESKKTHTSESLDGMLDFLESERLHRHTIEPIPRTGVGVKGVTNRGPSLRDPNGEYSNREDPDWRPRSPPYRSPNGKKSTDVGFARYAEQRILALTLIPRT